MKIGAEHRGKAVGAGGLLLVAAVMVVRWAIASPTSSGSARDARTIEDQMPRLGHGPVDPTLELGTLRETETAFYFGNGRDIFHVIEDRRPVEPPRKEEAKVDPSKVVVVAPIPLSFFGFSRKSGVSTVFLSKGDDVFLAKEGDIVDRRYKIVRVTSDAVEIEDLLSERSERLPLRRG